MESLSHSLPQFANLVRLEKSSGEVEEDLILSDMGVEAKKTEDFIEAVVDTSELELGEYKDVQLVTAGSDGVQLITRRVSTDSLTTPHPLLINQDLSGPDQDQVSRRSHTGTGVHCPGSDAQLFRS